MNNTTGGAAKPYASSVSYAPHGAVQSLSMGNQLTESWSYNNRLQPTGSTRLVTDGSQNVVARHDYLPFGEEVPSTYGGRSVASLMYGAVDGVAQKFTGKERDSESGLDYFGARYYGSGMGRFVSVDTGPYLLSDPQTLDRYSYARNDPKKYTDPTGRYFVLYTGDPYYSTFVRTIALMLTTSKGREIVNRIANDPRPEFLVSGPLSGLGHAGSTFVLRDWSKHPEKGFQGPWGAITAEVDFSHLGAVHGVHKKSDKKGYSSVFHELVHVADAIAAGDNWNDANQGAMNGDREDGESKTCQENDTVCGSAQGVADEITDQLPKGYQRNLDKAFKKLDEFVEWAAAQAEAKEAAHACTTKCPQ